MSRGPGHVERSIRRLFDTRPDEAFCLRDVIEWVWPDVIPGEKHRISAARAARSVVAKDLDWVSRAAPGGTTWFWNLASPASRAMYDMLGMSGSRGRVPRHGSNSGAVTRQEALQRLPREAEAYRDLCARHVTRRPRLAGLTAAERADLERDEERCRSILGEHGKELWDRGWSTAEITDVLTRAQVAADAAFDKFWNENT
jgi:hypothetical protein